MERQLIVEVLDRRGHVASRHRLDALPVTLGRGYGCAVILDDRYVSPEHARVEADVDGALAVVDLDSLNGLREAGRAARAHRIAIQAGTRIRLGQTVLRFCFSDQPVPAAVREAGESVTVGGRSLSPRHGLALGGAAALWVGWLTYLGSFDGERVAGAAAAAIGMSLAIALWAGIWALLGRLLVHRPRFSLHIGLAGLAVILSIAIGLVSGYAQFFAPQATAIDPVAASLEVLVIGGLLAGSLSLATALPRARRLAIGYGLSVGFAGLGWLAIATFDSSSERAARFEGEVKAVGEPWVLTVTPDRFFLDVERLIGQVDELAAQSDSTSPRSTPTDSTTPD